MPVVKHCPSPQSFGSRWERRLVAMSIIISSAAEAPSGRANDEEHAQPVPARVRGAAQSDAAPCSSTARADQ
jgi:hypothetical protein